MIFNRLPRDGIREIYYSTIEASVFHCVLTSIQFVATNLPLLLCRNIVRQLTDLGWTGASVFVTVIPFSTRTPGPTHTFNYVSHTISSCWLQLSDLLVSTQAGHFFLFFWRLMPASLVVKEVNTIALAAHASLKRRHSECPLVGN